MVFAVKFLEKLENSKNKQEAGLGVWGAPRRQAGSGKAASTEDSKEPGKATLGKQLGDPQ